MLAPIMAEEDKPTIWDKIGIPKVTMYNFLVNIGAFVLAVAITVGACMYKVPTHLTHFMRFFFFLLGLLERFGKGCVHCGFHTVTQVQPF